MRRLLAALSLSVLVATLACSESTSLVGPASDTSSEAALAKGQDPVSNNGITVGLQGQDPVSNNDPRVLRGQEPSSNN